MSDKTYIYESPDKGKTIFRREFGKTERELKTVETFDDWLPKSRTYWVPERRWGKNPIM